MTFRCLGLAALLTFTSTAPIKCDQTEKANHSSTLPTCSKPPPDLCADGCGPGFCCLEWKWVSVHEPVSLALQKQNVFLGMTFHTCADEKQMALIKKLKVAGQPYAQADLIQSTDFYMDWNAKEYRTEECGLAEIPMSECATYTKSDMVEKVWGGAEAAKQQIYQVKCSCDVGEVKERVSESMATAEPAVSFAKDAASSVDNVKFIVTKDIALVDTKVTDQTEKANHSSALPTCSKPAPDLCADGCGPGFCCLEWKWVSVHEPVSLALQKQNVFLGMTFHTCADEKQMALIKKLKVAGQPYAQADLIQSTDFYMDWNAKEYRTEECGLAEIPMSECATYTKSDMVEKVWGGVDAAKQQIYQVKCSCDVGEVKERVSESMATAERVVSIAKDAASSVDNAILMFT